MESKQVVLKHFEWTEWVDEAARDHTGGSHLPGSSGKATGVTWCGESFAEALERARGKGASEDLPLVDVFAQRIDAVVCADTVQTSFHAVYDTSGGEVDIARYLSGEPECMLQAEPIKIARMGRAVRIVVPGSYQGGTNPESVRMRGAAVVALCQILARAQHPLEVWAGYSNHGRDGRGRPNGTRHTYMVRVQQADQPLDEGRLMFALAREEANRRLCFAVKEQEPEKVQRQLGDGYGISSREVYGSDLPEAHGNTIILPDFDKRSKWTEESAIEWIRETLAELF